MIEERSHFCTLFNLFKPFLVRRIFPSSAATSRFLLQDLEISLAAEMSHIEELVQCLNKQTADPHCLPAASEQVIKDLKGIDYSSIVAFKVSEPIEALFECLFVFFSADATVVSGFTELAQVECLFDQQYQQFVVELDRPFAQSNASANAKSDANTNSHPDPTSILSARK